MENHNRESNERTKGRAQPRSRSRGESERAGRGDQRAPGEYHGDGERHEHQRRLRGKQARRLHPKCRIRGVTEDTRINLHPRSHFYLHPLQLISPSISIRSQHNTPPPTYRSRYVGRGRGATLPKTSGFRPRQVRLRHTCRVGRSPSNLPWQEGQRSRRDRRAGRQRPRALAASSGRTGTSIWDVR